MSLELINTAASLATVCVVAATAIAAVIQLKHLRVSNQINAVLEIGARFDAPTYVDAYLLLNKEFEFTMSDPAFRIYTIAHARNDPLPELDAAQMAVRRAIILIGNMYDEMGVLVRNGIIDRKLFVYQYSSHILEQWERLEPYVALVREASGSNTTWEMFEYLAVVTLDFTKNNPETYPHGMRRLKVVNPWPLSKRSV